MPIERVSSQRSPVARENGYVLPTMPARSLRSFLIAGIAVVVLSLTPAAHAGDPCHGECLYKAKSLMLEPTDRPLDEVLRSAQQLAARACDEKDDEGCQLGSRLKDALAEFTAVSKEKGVEAGKRVLSARHCMAALNRDEAADWPLYVTLWCATALDGCEPNLMGTVGLLSAPLRSAIVGPACQEKVCAVGPEPKPKVCAVQLTPAKASTVVALLRIVLSRELPSPTASALADAFERPWYPFFADDVAPAASKPKSKSRK